MKKKMNLKGLKVESFITDLDKENKQTVAGGRDIAITIQLNCTYTRDLRTCTWYSELGTACTCPASWNTACPSGDFRCEEV